MDILKKIQQSLIEAVKAKNEPRVLTLRGLSAAIHNKEIELKGFGKEVQEIDVLDVLRKELKKRVEASQLYMTGNRPELATKENTEGEIIKEFLPRILSEDEVRTLVDEVMRTHPGATQKDMGIIIKEVNAKANGAADGSIIAKLVKEKLI